MRFSVRHETLYRYSAPVRLGRHLLRLTPRDDGGTLVERRLIVEPTPVAVIESRDAHGNSLTTLEFAGETEILRIDSRFTLDTVVPPAWRHGAIAPVPWLRGDDPEVRRVVESEGGDPVRRFAEEIAVRAGGRLAEVLDLLGGTLHARTHHHIRGGGGAQAPEVTLATARGACRDTAVLFIDAARALGIPARFVSGYQARAETADGARHLHAWPEVLIPGFGWRGFDPTHGVEVGDGHVALAAAPEQAGTMPLAGGFWGDGVTSKLDYVVRIEAEG